jgi:plasmid stabilization system protein ParE
MNIIWSTTAERTYLLIIEQILEKWTPKEARRFIADVDKLLSAIYKTIRFALLQKFIICELPCK